jgi:hypothetical protein
MTAVLVFKGSAKESDTGVPWRRTAVAWLWAMQQKRDLTYSDHFFSLAQS